ncbi:MAG: c-type cytochrome [Phycisphaeraceae bacterium]|nr:c-type cytochrome [Phycisphaeraceae bacterium]MCB9847451.1 c-type cytochrome [Phycisphaeraceae bacterium]
MNALNHIASTLAANPMASNADLNLLERLMLSARSSDYAATHDMVYMVIFWLSVAFFVVVMGPYAYFIVKYRRKPGVPAQRSVSHNTPLELAWSIFPLMLLCVLFFLGFEVFIDGQVAPADAETINVHAKKWNWSLGYDNGALPKSEDYVNLVGTSVPVFAIPAGKPIRLVLESEDVIHSFYVPNFRKKIDVFPNRYTTMWFQAGNAGERHYVFCAEYCGDQHSQMAAMLDTLSPEDYDKWKTDHVLNPKDMFPADYGAFLYKQQGCNACHTVDRAKSAGTGPPWWGIWGRTENIEGGGQITVDENYVRESIYTPAAKIVQGFPNQMNSFQGLIDPEGISAIFAYMQTLSDEGQAKYEKDKAAWEAAKKAAEEAKAAQN